VELHPVEMSLDIRTKKLEEKSECKEQGPKESESGAERQVPTEEVAVKSSGITKKRPRGRRIAAGRRVRPTIQIRGDCESRRKLVAACRKVSRCAAVAWRRRNIFRDIRTQGNCGPRQKFCAAGIMVTLRARLARRKGTFAQRDPTRLCGTRSLERMGSRRETSHETHRPPGRQEPELKTTGTSEERGDNHECHRNVNIRAAIASGKRQNAHEGPI
jgi:hypothetical protein